MLPQKKYNFGVISKDDDLFIFGGNNGSSILKSCEIINKSTGDSLLFTFMKHARENLAVTLGWDGKAYVTGGYGG